MSDDKTYTEGELVPVHMRAYVEHLETDPEVKRFVLQVFPLPLDVIPELASVLADAAVDFLKARGFTDGEVTHVPVGTSH